MSTGLTKLILDDSNAFAVKLLAERAKRQFLSAAFIGVLCFCDPGEHATSLGLRDHTIKLQSYNHDTLMIRWWYHHADAYKCRSGWVISDSLIVSSPSECDSVASSYHCLKGRAGPNRSKLMQVRPSGCVVIDGKKSWKKLKALMFCDLKFIETRACLFLKSIFFYLNDPAMISKLSPAWQMRF